MYITILCGEGLVLAEGEGLDMPCNEGLWVAECEGLWLRLRKVDR